MSWIYMIVPLYITYYTFTFAKKVYEEEKNILATIFISILAISITVLSFYHKLK